MIQIFNPSLIDLTRADGQKKGKKLNSDLAKASPIIITKSPTKKHNQNEDLETNFVSPSEMPKPQRKQIFSIREKAFYEAKCFDN